MFSGICVVGSCRPRVRSKYHLLECLEIIMGGQAETSLARSHQIHSNAQASRLAPVTVGKEVR